MMIRFRNPGTQFSTQVQVIKQLYAALGSQAYFTLDDMAIVIAQGNLMTAYGYAGDAALRLSYTDQESMNSAKMNAKMYAEVFRMLGWVTPYNEEKSYPLVFTYIGIHVALSQGDCTKLYEQCVLGINNPTQFSGRMRYTEKVRFIKCALRSLIDLGGVMYKHELNLGPMCVNDEDEEEYDRMIEYIRSIRGDIRNLKREFTQLAESLGMTKQSVDNCTRLPIAFMEACGMTESVRTRELYGVSQVCIQITQHGIDVYNSIKDMYDLRLDSFLSLDEQTQNALIRLGTYSMLDRAGYDLSEIKDTIEADRNQCLAVLGESELLFSPSQTLRRSRVENALGIELGTGDATQQQIDTFGSTVEEREALYHTQVWQLNIPEEAATELLTSPEDFEFLDLVNQMSIEGKSSSEIVSELFDYYANATQTVFYPLIATLFKTMGFNCSFSRPGDNGARWDAIIDDPQRSIPIEIKSPTEEQHLSIKAIRQALENKIVLLSRQTFITAPDISTLAVGYYMPNERAEVNRLISDIKETYGYKIGVVDLKSLLSLAVSILVDGRGFNKEQLFSLEGLMNASI